MLPSLPACRSSMPGRAFPAPNTSSVQSAKLPASIKAFTGSQTAYRTCFAGQNIGARKPRRVLSSMYVSLFWALSFGVVFGVLSCVFGTQLLGLYSPDPAVIQVGLNRMYIVCGPYFLCGIMDVMTGVLRGVGYSLLPMIVSLMGACVFRIFWVMTIFAANRTMDCLMISYPVSWALTFLVLVVIFAVLWKKKIRPRYTPEELAAR